MTEGTNVNDGGAGSDVTLRTTTAGNVIITGQRTGADQVTVNSVGSFNGAGLVTALVVDLNAVTGIGFFFQAEDGIRDDLVTGVQTCALPIYSNAGATTVSSLTTGAGTITFD